MQIVSLTLIWYWFDLGHWVELAIYLFKVLCMLLFANIIDATITYFPFYVFAFEHLFLEPFNDTDLYYLCFYVNSQLLLFFLVSDPCIIIKWPHYSLIYKTNFVFSLIHLVFNPFIHPFIHPSTESPHPHSLLLECLLSSLCFSPFLSPTNTRHTTRHDTTPLRLLRLLHLLRPFPT